MSCPQFERSPGRCYLYHSIKDGGRRSWSETRHGGTALDKSLGMVEILETSFALITPTIHHYQNEVPLNRAEETSHLMVFRITLWSTLVPPSFVFLIFQR